VQAVALDARQRGQAARCRRYSKAVRAVVDRTGWRLSGVPSVSGRRHDAEPPTGTAIEDVYDGWLTEPPTEPSNHVYLASRDRGLY